MKLQGKKIGVVGGSQGLGQWLVRYFAGHGFDVGFTSADEYSQFADNATLARHVDIVFLAVPISVMQPVLEELYPHMHGKVLVEICSVKKFVVETYERLCAQYPDLQVPFLSLHPMFGPSVPGLRGQVMLFTHAYALPQGLEESLRERFQQDGGLLYTLPYLRHDKLMGIVQGLNHFNVFVSAKTLARFEDDFTDIKLVSSPPYRIFLVFFTRYVLQNPRLYADIQMSNEFVYEVVRIFRDEMNRLFDLIQTKDREGFVNYIAEMQPYFEGNRDDSELSNHLIEQLGTYLDARAR